MSELINRVEVLLPERDIDTYINDPIGGYPIPAGTELHLTVQEGKDFTVVDAQGKVLAKYTIHGNGYTVEIDGLKRTLEIV